MKRIFKTVSGKKKSTFMIGGKHICPHDRKSVKMAIGKVAGSVLAGILAVTATPLMAGGLTASALSPAQSVVFAWTPTNGQIRLNGGAEVYDVKTDESSKYVELNNVKYYQDMRGETSYWVREGFSIETDESGISGITAGEAANWNGVITSSGSTILPSDTSTVLNNQLQTVNLDNYVSSSNSSTTRLNDRDTLLDQSGEELSTMEVHYQDGQYYVEDGDGRKEVPVGALYSETTMGQSDQSKLVAVVTQDGKIYTGDVVGGNGEILKSGIENSKLYSYWANQTADPSKGATVGQVQAVIDTMKENGKNLANADIQGITVNDGIATITRKNGGSAGEFEAGNNVTITSGENGRAVIAATDTITEVEAGSNITAVLNRENSTDTLKIYTVDLNKDVDLGADGSLEAAGVTISDGQVVGEKFTITHDGGAVLASGDVRVSYDGAVRVGGTGNDANTTLYKDGTINNKVGDTTFMTGTNGVSMQNSGNQIVVSEDGTSMASSSGNAFVVADAGVATLVGSSAMIVTDGTIVTQADSTQMSVNDNGVALNNKKITGVAAGDISETSTDAVNGSQLKATNDKVETNATNIQENTKKIAKGMNYSADSGSVVNRQLGQTVAIKGDGNISTETTGDGIKVKLADDVRVDSVEAKTEVKVGNTSVRSDGVTINRDNGQSMVFTRQRVDMGGQQVHGVAAGTADTDAVNFAQLKATEAQFNQRLGDMDNHINRVEDNAYAGVAMALATAGLPQAWQPGKSMIAAAAGTYMGEQGYAFGLSYNTEDGKYTFKATASGNSQGHFGGSVGAGYMW